MFYLFTRSVKSGSRRTLVSPLFGSRGMHRSASLQCPKRNGRRELFARTTLPLTQNLQRNRNEKSEIEHYEFYKLCTLVDIEVTL